MSTLSTFLILIAIATFIAIAASIHGNRRAEDRSRQTKVELTEDQWRNIYMQQLWREKDEQRQRQWDEDERRRRDQG